MGPLHLEEGPAEPILAETNGPAYKPQSPAVPTNQPSDKPTPTAKPPQKYYTDGSKDHPFISSADVAVAFTQSSEGLKRTEELASELKPSELDMARLAKKK